MNKKEKLEKFFEEIMYIPTWAEEQRHITEKAKNILQENIYKAIKDNFPDSVI